MTWQTDIQRSAYIRNEAVEYIEKFIGLPYRWGGDDTIEGFDCSGLIHEVLQAHGVEKRGFDSTANDLYLWLLARNFRRPVQGYAGCLVFWPKKSGGGMGHVAMMIDDKFIIHAARGGSKVTSRETAAQYNAFVCKDPIHYRGQGYIIIDPFSGGA